MSGHLDWHLALCKLGLSRFEEAASLVPKFRPNREGGAALQKLADSASFLWRCQIYDIVPPPGVLEEVLEHARAAFPRAGQSFADVHKAMVFALLGDAAAGSDLAGETRELIEAAKLPAGAVVPAVIEATCAFAEGRYEDCGAILGPYAEEIGRVGGSRAQYEVIQDMLIAAYIKSDAAEEATGLLRERLRRRPSRRDETWVRQLAEPPTIAG